MHCLAPTLIPASILSTPMANVLLGHCRPTRTIGTASIRAVSLSKSVLLNKNIRCNKRKKKEKKTLTPQVPATTGCNKPKENNTRPTTTKLLRESVGNMGKRKSRMSLVGLRCWTRMASSSARPAAFDFSFFNAASHPVVITCHVGSVFWHQSPGL